MDYYGTKFEFDLQLFTDGAFDVTVPSTTTETQYLCKGESDEQASWKNAPAGDDTVSAKFTPAAEGAAAKLEVIFKSSDSVNLTVKGASTGVKIIPVASFDAENDYAAKGSTAAVENASVAFEGAAGLSVAVAYGASVSDNEGASEVVLGEGRVLTVSETVKVTVNEKTYTSGNEGATMTLTSDSGEALTGAITLSAGDVTTATNGAAITVTTGTGDTAKTSTVTNGAEKSITVTSAGLVSGLAAEGAKVSITTGTGDDAETTTYTAIGSGTVTAIAATGSRVGVYEVTSGASISADLAAGTIKSTGSEATTTLDPKEITLTLNAANATVVSATTATTKYYKLLNTGVDISEAVDTAPTIGSDNVIGYFVVTTSWNAAKPTVTVTFVGKTLEDGETVSDVPSYLGKVTVDATAVAEITNTGAGGAKKNVTVVTMDSIGSSTEVTNLYHEADTDADSKTYLAHYELSGTKNKITIPVLDANNSNGVYFKITQTEKAADGTITYEIAETYSTETLGDNEVAFQITTGTEDGGKIPYTIALAKGTGMTGFALTDSCWANGIVIDAKNLAATTSIAVTGAANDTATYTVTNVKNGIAVTSTSADVTSVFDHTYYTFSGSIALSGTAGVEYYTVTPSGNDGNVTLTLAEVTGDENLAKCKAGTYDASYFTVTTTAGVDDVPGKVSISYTNNKNISLKGLQSTAEGHAAIYVPVTASSLAAENIGSVTFSSPMNGTVEVAVTGLVSGIMLNEGSKAVAMTEAGAVTSTGIVKAMTDCTYAQKNGISIDLASVGEGKTAYFAVTSTPNTTLRANTLTAGEGQTSATGMTNYYTVKNEDGKLTITYTQAETGGIGITTVSTFTADSEDITSIAFDQTSIGANVKVTDANAKLTSLTVNGTEYKDGGDSGHQWSNANSVITFTKTEAFAKNANKLSVDGLTSDDTKNYVVTAGATPAKGVTSYTIATDDKASPTDASDNYFTVKYDSTNKKVTITYHAADSSGTITPAKLGSLGAIAIDGSKLPAGTTTLVLTKENDTADAIAYKVTDLPKTVTTIENGTGTGDDITYATTYALADGASIKLTDASTVAYYEVTVDTEVEEKYGVKTCKVTALTPKDESGKALEGDALVKYLAQKNYFKVDSSSSASAIAITYHQVDQTDMSEDDKKKYVKIALGGSTLEVDPTGAVSKAQITVGTGSGDDAIVFKVTDMTKDQAVTIAGNSSAVITGSTYETSYTIAYTPESGHVSQTDGILLTDETSETAYFTLTKTGGEYSHKGVVKYQVEYTNTLPTIGGDLVGYITVANGATGYGVSVTYTGEDMSALKPPMTEQFAINASGAASTVTTIDLANTSGKIAYALTNVKCDVTNTGVNDTYAAQATIALVDTLTLGGETDPVTYYIVGSDGKLTASEDEPTKKENYISVTKNSDGSDYKVEYTAASEGTAYTLDSSKSALAVNAAALAEGTTVTFNDGGIKNAVTGAKGSVTVADTTSNTTISYTTTFAWAAGTYYTRKAVSPATNTELTATGATAVTTDPTDSNTTFNKAVVTVTDGVYKVAISSVKMNSNGSGMESGGSTDINVITVDGTKVTKFDGTGLNGTLEVKGFATGATVVNAGSTTTFTGTGVITIDPDASGTGSEAVTYTASSDTGVITVQDGKGVSGTFKVTGKTIFSASKLTTAEDGKFVAVQMPNADEDDEVTVTFTDGVITSITGLDTTEEVQVTVKGTPNTVYAYTYDATAGTVTKRNTSTGVETVAGADSNKVNIVALDYQNALATVKVNNAFNWNSGDYYFAVTSGAATVATRAAGTEPTTLANNSYVHANLTNAGVLTLKGVTGTAAKTVNPDASFAGTVNVTPDIAISYTKVTTDLFKVAFTGVLAGSTFTGLAVDKVTGDTIETANLAIGDAITVDSVAYTAATAGKLKFTDGLLTDGTVTIGTTPLKIADGTQVKISGGSAVLTVADGEITSITGIESGETVTVTTNLTTTEYTWATATTVTKTVTTTATGNKETSTITIAAEGDNVYGVDGVLTTVPTDFDFNGTKTGYVTVASDGKATITEVTGGTTIKLMNDGTVYVKASVESDAKDAALKVLTLTPMVFNGTELTPDGVDTSVLKLTVEGNSTSGTKLSYNGSQSEAVVTVTNVLAGSVFTNLVKGSTVTTKDALTKDDVITVNGTTYKAAANDTFKVYAANSRTPYLVEGTVTVTGTMASSKLNGDDVRTLVYTAGTDDGSKNGVVVAYTSDGEPATITDLDKGEKVTITKGNVVTTYEAHSSTIIWKTVTGDATPANNGTFVATITADADVIAGGSGYGTAKTTTQTFSWAGATETTPATGDFIVSDKKATLVDGASSISYQDEGKTYVHASITSAGDLTLTAGAVGTNGTLGAASAISSAAYDVVLTLPTAGQKVTLGTRPDTTGAVTVTNAAAGSTIFNSGWTAKDSVSTVALDAGETLTVGGKVYTAAKDDTEISVAGLVDEVPVITAGAVKLSGAKDSVTATITAQTTDSEKNVITTVVKYDPNSTTVEDKNISVLVSGGTVESITGLEALKNANGEKVTVTTTTTPAVGTATVSTATYTAEYCTDPGKVGQIKVTKEEDGVTSTQIFTSGAKNIFVQTGWTPENQVTTQNFDWTKTGYFRAVSISGAPTVYNVDGETKDAEGNTADSIAKQTQSGTPAAYNEITGDNEGEIYLEVVSTKGTEGVAKVTELNLVKVNKDGTFSAATGTIGKIAISAADAAGGITLPEHTATVAITGAADGSVFTGLEDEDTVAGTGFTGTVTVNGDKYTVAAANAFKIEGVGNIVEGTFTITGEATSAAEATPLTATDGGVINQSVKVESTASSPNGVKVVFDKKEGITSIANVDAGETVTVTLSDGSTKKFVAAKDTTDDSKALVTQTIHFAGTTMPADLVLTKSAVVNSANVLDMTGYQAANKFDFGQTATTGQVGLCAVTTKAAEIKTQTAVESAFSTNGTYLLVGATKADSGYTINHLEVLAYNQSTGTLKRATAKDTVEKVTITAPTDGNLTLLGSAVQLYQEYTYNSATKTYKLSTDNSETERTYAINVKGAKDGMTYTGFNELDTISTSGTLAQGATLTVGTTTYTAAESAAVTIRGDGKAVKGVFAIGTAGLESAGSGFTAGITGAAAAIVKFVDGKVESIKNVAAGQTVTVAETDDSTKAVTTTAYTAAAVEGSTDLKITKVVTVDGVATTYTGTVGASDSVTDATWATGVSEASSRFTWKSADGVGYFLTDVTDTVKDFGTELTVDKQSETVTAKAGKYYLKVALSADGVVSGITLHKVNADGSLAADSLNLVTAGTINIAAPATALTIPAISQLNANVKLNITDAVAKSDITMRAGDALKTATLAVDETINVGGLQYTAGAEGFMEFKDDAKLVRGTLKFAAISTDQTIATSKYTVMIADATEKDTGILVKVLDGGIASISGFKTDGAAVVTIKDGANTIAAYNKAGVTLTAANIPTGAYTTVTLDAGKTVQVDSAATYTTGASGTVKFDKAAGGALTVDSGTLKFTADSTAATQITTKTDGVVTFNAYDDGSASNDLVTVKNGEVTSVTGLKTGDIVKVGTTTYTAKSATVIEKTVGGEAPVTAYLTTAGGDVVSAKYVEGDDGTDISKEENALEGQLSWADVSGRSTGYFTVDASNKATVQEQSTKVKVGDKLKSGAGPTTYVVANAATDEDTKLQTLTIGALSAENNGTTTTIKSTDAETLLAGKTITVTAPTTKVTTANGYEIVPALKYEKKETDTYSIVINKVAADSVITGLKAGDKVTTNTLAADDSVMMNGTAYQTDVKGTLEFLGEGDDSADAPDNRATLLKGVVRLNASAEDYTTAVLSGSKDGTGEDITVVAGGNDVSDDIVVTVANGVVTSITGLETVGATVTVTQTGFPQVTYKLLSREYASYNKTTDVFTYNTIIERTEGTGDSAMKTYASFTNLKNIYGKTSANGTVSNGYKEAATTDTDVLTDKLWSNTEGKAQTVYVATNYNDILKVASGTALAMTTSEVASGNEIKASDSTNRGKYYVAATVKTKDDVTTITGLAVAQVNALGVPTVVRGATVESIDIDGAITGGDTKAKISFAIPKTTTVNITNAALGSTFTAVKEGDFIDSAATGEAGYALAKGTTTIYNANDGVQETTKVTYVPVSRDTTTATIITDNDGEITSITGLDTAKESVTIVKTTAEGEVTTVYAVSSVKVGSGTVLTMTKTVTDADGAKTVKTGALSAIESPASYNWVDDNETVLTEDVDSRTVVSEFDWTTAKRATGYFAVTTKNGNASADVKASTKATTIAPVTRNVANTTSYLAVTIDDADGVLKEIKQVRFDRSDVETYNTLQPYGNNPGETKFAGTINVTAPTGVELIFDRSTVDATTIDESATVAIKGAIADSEITKLQLGDTVTTAKLAVANAKTGAAAQSVEVGLENDANGVGTFTVGAAGQLSFLAQTVDGDTKLTVTGGTIALVKANTNVQGVNFAYIGTKLVTATKGDITVAVLKNGASYTIGDLKEGETFTVDDLKGTVKTYQRSGTTLFCSTVSNSGTTNSVYTLGTKTSVTSDVLNKTNGWTTYTDANAAFKETADGLELVSGKAVTVNLANLDKRLTADKKTGASASTTNYEFVIDKYMAAPTRFNGVASVIHEDNHVDVQQIVGWVTPLDYVYQAYGADGAIAQAIAAADKWAVYGSEAGDNITGASKGNDTLIGAVGNDTLVGGNANDVFAFTLKGSGNDTVTKYMTGKDKIVVGTDNNNGTYTAGDAVSLANIALVAGQSGRNAADVLLHDGTYDEAKGEATNSVLLAGMGNGKAVTINDATYYFGNAATNKAMTFTYTEGAYYLADASANTAKAGNTINVTTDKTKATAKTLGDTVTVNLADTEHYVGIKAVNAKSSGNRVYLAAGDTGATLTGGTFESTLKGGDGADSLIGGSGADTFTFDSYAGADKVSGYMTGKDAIQLANGLENYEIVGNDVKLYGSSESDSVTLEKMANGKAVTIKDADGNATSYYFGKEKSANTFTGKDGMKDVYLVNADVKTSQKKQTIKLFGTEDEIRIQLNESASISSIQDLADYFGGTISSKANSKGIYTSTLTDSSKKTILSVTGVDLVNGVDVSTSNGVATITAKKD